MVDIMCMPSSKNIQFEKMNLIRYMENAMLAYIRLKNKNFFIVIFICDGCLFTICTRSLSAEEG